MRFRWTESFCRELAVDAIEDVLLVALVVEDGELGGIEEAAGVEAVDLE